MRLHRILYAFPLQRDQDFNTRNHSSAQISSPRFSKQINSQYPYNGASLCDLWPRALRMQRLHLLHSLFFPDLKAEHGLLTIEDFSTEKNTQVLNAVDLSVDGQYKDYGDAERTDIPHPVLVSITRSWMIVLGSLSLKHQYTHAAQLLGKCCFKCLPSFES